MGDRMRDEFVAEIERLRAAVSKSDSVKLRTDYIKRIKTMTRELKEYDSFHGKGAK